MRDGTPPGSKLHDDQAGLHRDQAGPHHDQARGAARIVIVEDNSGDVYLLEQTLQSRKIAYELTRYEDGEQAIRAFETGPAAAPDLFLVDLNLPRREGFDVLRAIRGIPRFVGIPVGILTSSEAQKDRHRTALIGAERYIHKPPTLDEFVDHVGAAVENLLALSAAREDPPGSC